MKKNKLTGDYIIDGEKHHMKVEWCYWKSVKEWRVVATLVINDDISQRVAKVITLKKGEESQASGLARQFFNFNEKENK